MIDHTDEYLHRGNDHPFWNESANFSFAVHEASLNGYFHFFHRPNLGFSVAGTALWDSTGEHAYDCLFHDFGVEYPTPAGAEMFDFALPNGVKVECIEPLHSYRLTYTGSDCDLLLNWEASHPPNEDKFPPAAKAWGAAHYEQIGRMSGHLAVAGQTFDVDCASIRDHSWGPRQPGLNTPRADVAWALADQDNGFMAMAVCPTTRAADTVLNSQDVLLPGFGFHIRDGVTASIMSGTRRVADRDPGDGRPKLVVIELEDELGRKLDAHGRCHTWLHSLAYPYLMHWWCLTEWEFGDGRTAWGEEQDTWAIEHYRKLLREHRFKGMTGPVPTADASITSSV